MYADLGSWMYVSGQRRGLKNADIGWQRGGGCHVNADIVSQSGKGGLAFDDTTDKSA